MSSSGRQVKPLCQPDYEYFASPKETCRGSGNAHIPLLSGPTWPLCIRYINCTHNINHFILLIRDTILLLQILRSNTQSDYYRNNHSDLASGRGCWPLYDHDDLNECATLTWRPACYFPLRSLDFRLKSMGIMFLVWWTKHSNPTQLLVRFLIHQAISSLYFNITGVYSFKIAGFQFYFLQLYHYQ